jgi:hypothetical protein
MATINAVKKYTIADFMLLATAALGALLDMKPSSAKDFINLFFTPEIFFNFSYFIQNSMFYSSNLKGFTYDNILSYVYVHIYLYTTLKM